MITTILGAFRVGEIRNKLLFTAAILAMGLHESAYAADAATKVREAARACDVFAVPL